MEQKTIQVYKYEELSDDAKETALNSHIESNDFDFLEESLTEYLKELLTEAKIDGEAELSYSLSCCKGDGVSFTGNFEYKGVNISVTRNNSHYVHSNSVDIEAEADEDDDDDLKNDLIEAVTDEAEAEFKEIFKEICDKIEKVGYSEIEYQNSEESFKENCEANEYTFRENGEMENI